MTFTSRLLLKTPPAGGPRGACENPFMTVKGDTWDPVASELGGGGPPQPPGADGGNGSSRVHQLQQQHFYQQSLPPQQMPQDGQPLSEQYQHQMMIMAAQGFHKGTAYCLGGGVENEENEDDDDEEPQERAQQMTGPGQHDQVSGCV